jgi:hypothetical protein
MSFFSIIRMAWDFHRAEVAKRRKRRENLAVVAAASRRPVKLIERLKAADRPHEHFTFRDATELRDIAAVEWKATQLSACVECMSRARYVFRESVRLLAQAPFMPPEMLEAFERAVAESEQKDPAQRLEKEWREADKGTPQ